jgi:isopenicillin N synthase-like dioxygenase
MDIRTLETAGFVRIPYPPALRAGVLEAVAAWKSFCMLPNAAKQLISYSGDVNVSGVGYELKLEKGKTADLKEDFHLRVSERHLVEENVRKAGPEAVLFMEKALALAPLMEPVIFGFAEAAEREYGMAGFLADTRDRMPRALIRFLHYFGDRQPGDELAVAHVDKGGFTLHLHESHPGLQHLAFGNERWEPMDFGEGETAIIPAMRMQYRSENRLKATCHRVVANEETARIGRYSAVCFMDFANTPYYDKERRGRLQDQPPAFNYKMPFDEFKDFFTPVKKLFEKA